MVIVGGMSLGTLLTLFVVPTFYTLLTRKNRDASTRAEAAMAEARGEGPAAPHAAAGPASATASVTASASATSPAAGS